MSGENKVFIYDTTLRDGAQAEGVTFSPVSKIHVAKMLDAFEVIEKELQEIELEREKRRNRFKR